MQAILPGALDGSSATDLESLSLPRLTSQGNSRKAIWRALSYDHFAQQLERQNPDTIFTKEIADAAFRSAVKKATFPPSATGSEAAIARVSTPTHVALHMTGLADRTL